MIELAIDHIIAIVMTTLATGVIVGVAIGLNMALDETETRNQHETDL